MKSANDQVVSRQLLSHRLDKHILKDILQWNIAGWQPAIFLWNKVLMGQIPGRRDALEIGARDGGVSLYFALKDMSVICSDIYPPTDKAIALHKKYGVQGSIHYEKIDVTKIQCPSESFDVVAFKSVLGAIGCAGGVETQQNAINELLRVLKKGGLLLFAENLTGSTLHSYLRRKLLRNRGPNNSWFYPTADQMQNFLSAFKVQYMEQSGIFSPLGRNELQRLFLNVIDQIINPVVPNNTKLICYGYAIK